MPGRLYLTRTVADLATELDLPESTFPNVEPRRNIAPGDQVLVLNQHGASVMRWGIIPVGRVNARGRPVMETIINARSETVFDKSAFEGVGRAIVPVDGWYEWTGEKRRKTAWDISLQSKELMYFAAITDVWVAPGGLEVPQIATVTCAPNDDLREIHHRMGCILTRDQIQTWLTGTEEEAATLLSPLPNGLLRITEADSRHFR